MSFQTINPLAVYPSNGVALSYPVPDKFYDAADVKVFMVNKTTDVETRLVYGVEYSVQVVLEDPTPPSRKSGNVILVANPGLLFDIVVLIWPNSDQDQPFEGRPVTPRQNERVHDRHSMRDASLREILGRGFRSPLNAPQGLRYIVNGAEGYVPIFDSAGNLIQGPSISQIALAEAHAAAADADRIAAQQAKAAAEAARDAAIAAASSMISSIFANRTTLQAYSPAIAPAFLGMMGWYAAGDAGGMITLKFVAVQPTHAGKASITLQGGTVAWYEVFDSTGDIRRFGAKGSGSAVDAAVNKAAVDAAIATLGRAVIPQTALGFDFGTNVFNLSTGQSITGVGEQPLVKSACAGNFISVFGYDIHTTVENLTFDMLGSSPGSCAIRLRGDYTVTWGIRLRNLRFVNCYGAIKDVGQRTQALTNAFSTTSGSPTVTLHAPAHGLIVNTVVSLTAVSVGGLAMGGDWVVTVINANTLQFTHTSNAASTVATTGSTTVTYRVAYTVDVEISDIQCRQAYGTQIDITSSRGLMVFRDVFIDNTVGCLSEPMTCPFVEWTSFRLTDPIGIELERIHVVGQAFIPSRPCTISIATPGVISRVGHALANGTRIQFVTTGALPTGIATNTVYYVVNAAANTFQVSLTLGGAAVATSGIQSGSHKYTRAISTPSARGIEFIGTTQPVDFFWGYTVRAEATLGIGIVLSDITFGDFFGLEGFGVQNVPVYFSGCSKLRLTNLFGRGAIGQEALPPNVSALVFEDCDDLQINTWGGAAATGIGVQVIDSVDCIFTNGRIEVNILDALVESGTSDRNTFRDTTMEGNGADQATLVGPRSRLVGGFAGTTRLPDSGSVFRSHKNGVDQAAAGNSFVKLTFPVEEMDFGRHFDPATSRWTPPAGPVDIRATCLVSAGVDVDAEMTILIYKNGTAIASDTRRSGTANPMTVSVDASLLATGTDYFEVYVYLAGASGKTISGGASRTWFSGELT